MSRCCFNKVLFLHSRSYDHWALDRPIDCVKLSTRVVRRGFSGTQRHSEENLQHRLQGFLRKNQQQQEEEEEEEEVEEDQEQLDDGLELTSGGWFGIITLNVWLGLHRWGGDISSAPTFLMDCFWSNPWHESGRRCHVAPQCGRISRQCFPAEWQRRMHPPQGWPAVPNRRRKRIPDESRRHESGDISYASEI